MRRNGRLSAELGVLVALLAAVAMLSGGVASADGPETPPVPQAAQKDESPAPSAAAGMKAAVDRQTGKLRRLTAEEEKELDAAEHARQAKQAQAAAPAPVAVQHANGMTSLVLGPEFLEFMNTAVATVGPDGTVSWSCVPSVPKAEELVRSDRVPSQQAPALEEK